EDHMSLKGLFLTAKTYYHHKHNKMNDDAIFLEHGTSFDTICDAQDRQIKRYQGSFPAIHTMQEHYEYILKNFVEAEDAVKLREKMEGKTDEEIIHLMPVAFAWVLSIHLLQRMRRGREPAKPAAPEPKSMVFEDESDALDLL
ncbi:unnamed protein product, partial [marine sediment metagenome]